MSFREPTLNELNREDKDVDIDSDSSRQPSPIPGDLFCLCGGRMNKGQIKHGAVRCDHAKCGHKALTGLSCYYCPNGRNVEHRNGFFLCPECAEEARADPHKVFCVDSARSTRKHKQWKKKSNPPRIIKQGYMSKKVFFGKSYKKHWFKLFDNKKIAYFAEKYALSTEGHTDLSHVHKVEKKGQHGLEITTKTRTHSFLLSAVERDEWYDCIQWVCFDIEPEIKHPEVLQTELEPVILIEDDIDISFVAEHEDRWEDEAPPAAYSRPSTPYTPPEHNADLNKFPDISLYCDHGEGRGLYTN